MEKTELTIAVKKTKNRRCHEDTKHVGTYIANEDHEFLKLLVDLRNTNVSQFLKDHIYSELDKNRENLELIQMAIAEINSRSDAQDVKVIDIA